MTLFCQSTFLHFTSRHSVSKVFQVSVWKKISYLNGDTTLVPELNFLYIFIISYLTSCSYTILSSNLNRNGRWDTGWLAEFAWPREDCLRCFSIVSEQPLRERIRAALTGIVRGRHDGCYVNTYIVVGAANVGRIVEPYCIRKRQQAGSWCSLLDSFNQGWATWGLQPHAASGPFHALEIFLIHEK